jgi:hypothetical protein
MAVGNGKIFTLDYPSQAIHEYAIAKDGKLSGLVSTVYPAQYDTSGCGGLTGQGMLDPTGTHLTVKLGGNDCEVWQTFRLHDDGTCEFLGQDNSGQWVWRDGEVDMGFPGPNAMSADGQYAYAVGEIEGWSFLAGMKRDASGVLRIWNGFDWPYDTQYRYQPGAPVTDGNNHVVIEMSGQTNATWGQIGLASFSIDPNTGNLKAISTYDNMPKLTESGNGYGGLVFSPLGDYLIVSGPKGTLETFQFHDDGPATPIATSHLQSGQYVQQMAWDTSHHLYVLAQTLPKQPAIAQFSLYVFTAEDGQLKPAPGSPWNVPNAGGLLVVPRD